jgi:hypothetical protein
MPNLGETADGQMCAYCGIINMLGGLLTAFTVLPKEDFLREAEPQFLPQSDRAGAGQKVCK